MLGKLIWGKKTTLLDKATFNYGICSRQVNVQKNATLDGGHLTMTHMRFFLKLLEVHNYPGHVCMLVH